MESMTTRRAATIELSDIPRIMAEGYDNSRRSSRRREKAWSARGIRRSGRLQVALPRVDADGEAGVAVVAPQYPGVEPHGVEPLRVLAGVVRAGIREHVRAMDSLDDAPFAPGVAR